MPKVLFAVSEVHPLIKTGGLADFAGSLPVALQELRHDVRLVLPAYRPVLAQARAWRVVARLELPGQQASILEGALPGTRVTCWLVHAPKWFDRPGGPYTDASGHDWPDNAARYALFAHAVTRLALGQTGLNWRARVVHCNDWQTGLVPALLSREADRPATLFTIHNLAYQGLFPAAQFPALHLPAALWGHDGLEFHGQLSFIKGGLIYADRINTVSPTYAEEITTSALGYGLEGLIKHRAAHVSGILNGVDYRVWDPARDLLIIRNYSSADLAHKAANKQWLQQHCALPVQERIPLIGMVGRLVEQKGIDMLLAALPQLVQLPLQLVLLGSGARPFEDALQDWARRYPQRLSVHIGYSEELAHRIEAGSDMFLMPSRFEPCGLNQLYSLRYGTVPIVRRTGGLADTVLDASADHLKQGRATGIVFSEEGGAALLHAVRRALDLFSHPPTWRALMLAGMRQDYSWGTSARRYSALYQQAIAARR
ncbi:MAG: glycogen synthase GlgA [Gammaproteobacteria bacterium]|nr:glycogen synthase GlgA [Gammaproteobacteria bacterium]